MVDLADRYRLKVPYTGPFINFKPEFNPLDVPEVRDEVRSEAMIQTNNA